MKGRRGFLLPCCGQSGVPIIQDHTIRFKGSGSQIELGVAIVSFIGPTPRYHPYVIMSNQPSPERAVDRSTPLFQIGQLVRHRPSNFLRRALSWVAIPTGQVFR